VCYTLKVLCSSYNLFAGTDTLSLSVYKPIAKQILVGGPWGVVLDPQIGGRCGARGSKMVPFESLMSVSYYFHIVTTALSLTVFAEPSNVTDGRTIRITITNQYANALTRCIGRQNYLHAACRTHRIQIFRSVFTYFFFVFVYETLFPT